MTKHAFFLFWMLTPMIGAPAPSSGLCGGDCDDSGEVAIEEVVTGVRIAHGWDNLLSCSAIDRNRNDSVSIEELIGAVNNALSGCEICSADEADCYREPFRFETFAQQRFSLFVTLDGEPAPYATITVTDTLSAPPEGVAIEDVTSGALYFRGATDSDGSVEATLRIPTHVSSVDVVVNLPQAAGPYSDESLRALWGPFAPSSRVTVDGGALRGLNVALETENFDHRPTGPGNLAAGAGVSTIGEYPTTPVPNSILQTIGDILPEQSNAGAAFVSEVYSPNLVVTEVAMVDVIFLWEGAGYRNSLGYFTFEENVDGSVSILSSHLVFPNASFPSAGTMETGDTATLLDQNGDPRLFQPGERIGFFVIADGWRTEPRVPSWQFNEPGIPAADGSANAATGRGCYTSVNQINPEYAANSEEFSRHLAMIAMDGTPDFLGGADYFLTGFEDLNRTTNSDEDFNDLVFTLTATPSTAIENTNVARYAPGDPDGDGITGTNDSYPDDPDRAFVTRYPTFGQSVVAVEDLYPNPGDADYNDAVLAYNFQIVTDAGGNVKDLLGAFHLLARGATFDHRVGLHLPGVPQAASGHIEIERFLSGDSFTYQRPPSRSITDFVTVDQRRVPDIFPSTLSALPPLAGTVFTNTLTDAAERLAASTRVYVEFDQPVPAIQLGQVPYDLYFAVLHDGSEWDLHFPGHAGFPDRPAWLPDETGPSSFLDANGFPFLVEVPTSWQFTLEKVDIAVGYPGFSSWRTSAGSVDADWYFHPTSDEEQISLPLSNLIPNRTWSVGLPLP